MSATFSVVIPAHNEAAVIGRCLRALLANAPVGAEPEIFVVCNGCTDETAPIAGSASPAVRVIELAQGSKPLALNVGNAAATALPRFFVDADVVVSYVDLLEVSLLLRGGRIEAAAPRLFVELKDASSLIRRYYRVWCSLPYVKTGLVGSGVYGLSATGLERVGNFPNIIADDGYVRSCFTPAERASVSARSDGTPARFTVFPPRTLSRLLAIEIRRRAGVSQLRRLGYVEQIGRDNTTASILPAKSVGFSWGDLAVYAFVKIYARLAERLLNVIGKRYVWRRDESSRVTV